MKQNSCGCCWSFWLHCGHIWVVFTVGCISVHWKNLNHIQVSILRGKKNLLLALRAERIIFFAWEFVFSAPTKASLNNNNKWISKLQEGRMENYSSHLIKVMSESFKIIQGLNHHILMQLGCCRPLVQCSGREEQWIPFILGAAPQHEGSSRWPCQTWDLGSGHNCATKRNWCKEPQKRHSGRMIP